MKIEIKRMYDAVKAIEVEELKKKLELVGGSYEFEDHYLFIDYYDSDGNNISMLYNGTEYYYLKNVQGDITGLFHEE